MGIGVAFTVIVALFMHYHIEAAVHYVDVILLTVLILLFGSFFVHLSMLNPEGRGCSFHPSLCEGLQNGSVNSVTAIKTIIRTMLERSLAIRATHEFASPWWAWPIMGGKCVLLWSQEDLRIWMIGSPIVWWGGTAGLLIWCFLALLDPDKILWSAWIIFGWGISYLPFAFMSRPLWNHVYFIPLLYSLAASAVAAQVIAPNAVVAPLLLVALAAGSFWLYVPITYGTPIQPETFNRITLSWWTS
jgi:dolichyl-phosphate-mannose-protein mannosyltransferase